MTPEDGVKAGAARSLLSTHSNADGHDHRYRMVERLCKDHLDMLSDALLPSIRQSLVIPITIIILPDDQSHSQ
jgi:hypothetical protein